MAEPEADGPGRALSTARDPNPPGEPVSLLNRMRDVLLRPFRSTSDPTQTIAFTIAIIALAAKMAKADGHVSQHEVAVFRELFQVPVSEQANLERVFAVAKRSVHGYDSYARRLARMLRGRPDILERILDALFIIACADEGPIRDSEVAYLREVARIFGFDDAQFDQLLAEHAGDPEDAPYAVLGVHPTISDDCLKRIYRRLVRENHPDRLSGLGLPREFVTLANERLARINNAFHRIRKTRRPSANN